MQSFTMSRDNLIILLDGGSEWMTHQSISLSVRVQFSILFLYTICILQVIMMFFCNSIMLPLFGDYS